MVKSFGNLCQPANFTAWEICRGMGVCKFAMLKHQVEPHLDSHLCLYDDVCIYLLSIRFHLQFWAYLYPHFTETSIRLQWPVVSNKEERMEMISHDVCLGLLKSLDTLGRRHTICVFVRRKVKCWISWWCKCDGVMASLYSKRVSLNFNVRGV